MTAPHVPHHLPKWAIPVGIGAAVLLFLRAQSSGTSSTRAAQNLAATDGSGLGGANGSTLATADQLLQQQIGQQKALQLGQESLQNQQVKNFANLIKSPVVACPGGGLPRLVPDNSSPTGLSYGCQAHQSGGLTPSSFLGWANNALNVAGRAIGLANGVPGTPQGTPGITPNSPVPNTGRGLPAGSFFG